MRRQMAAELSRGGVGQDEAVIVNSIGREYEGSSEGGGGRSVPMGEGASDDEHYSAGAVGEEAVGNLASDDDDDDDDASLGAGAGPSIFEVGFDPR